MKRATAFLLLFPALISCSQTSMTRPAPSTLATDQAVEQVRQAEIGFAKAFNDRDEGRFTSMIDEHAYFLGPRRTLHGKTEILSVWSNLIRDNEFTWAPDRVVVNAESSLGLSTGPVRDQVGKVIGQYSSIWQRQSDGSWKVIFDGPGSFCPPP